MMMKRVKILVLAILLSSGVFASFNTYAQCPMCAANVKSSMNSTTKHTGLGLNAGIYILLVMPYALVAGVGLLWYTKSRKASMVKQRTVIMPGRKSNF
jgi:hypothetical protein